MAKKKVYFDAGHGGSDPGAVKYIKEADAAIVVVKAACDYLKKYYDCDVYQDISADSLATITARANKWKADLFISVHFNAGGGDGYEALVYGKDRFDLGQCFEKRIIAIGQNSRGVKYRPDLWVLKDTNMPAILNEIAFVDNKKDIQDFDEPAEQKAAGVALAKAAADYLKIPVKFTIKAKGNLIVREASSLSSKQVRRLTKGKKYTIVGMNAKGTRGKLKTGGWITITSKYIEIV